MLSTFIVYYIETNLICFLFLAFVFHTYARESLGLNESKWFLASLLTVQFYCISDILAAVFKNQTVAGARMILWISNTTYITLPLVMIIFWNLYVNDHVHAYYRPGKMIRRFDRAMAIGSILICVVSFSTPLTHFAFSLDELNGYHRSVGAYIVPLYAYLFMVYETVKLQIIRKHSDSLQIRHDVTVLSLFSIPCIFFSLIQVAVYGITISQVGFTMGIMMVFFGRQRNKISRDELTGLNNRREYEYAIDRMTRTSGTAMILMVDVDHFKSINDTYGHLEGDHALQSVAMILRKSCSNKKLFGSVALYRYGGDEFLMFSAEPGIENATDLLIRTILEETEKWNSQSQTPYHLSLSIGASCGAYSGKEIYRLIDAADKKMYISKARHN